MVQKHNFTLHLLLLISHSWLTMQYSSQPIIIRVEAHQKNNIKFSKDANDATLNIMIRISSKIFNAGFEFQIPKQFKGASNVVYMNMMESLLVRKRNPTVGIVHIFFSQIFYFGLFIKRRNHAFLSFIAIVRVLCSFNQSERAEKIFDRVNKRIVEQ